MTGGLPLFEPWMTDALCAQTDAEAFFPDKGGSSKEAKRVCASCDVVAECLAYALRNNERFGVWGGKSERERRALSEQDRTCRECGTGIHERPREARYCTPCATARRKQQKAADSRRRKAA